MKKLLYLLITICVFTAEICYCANTTEYFKKFNLTQKIQKYTICNIPIFSLDPRASLSRNDINIINKKLFKSLLKYKRLYYKEIYTIGLQYNDIWIDKLKDVANDIKKYKNKIIILEGFRNTELTDTENVDLSKEHALFIATILRDVYNIKFTMAVIGRGTEKNEELIYNCVIVTLIDEAIPSDII